MRCPAIEETLGVSSDRPKQEKATEGFSCVKLAASDAVVFERLFVVLAERVAFPILRAEDAA
jgi:hypothetical protein